VRILPDTDFAMMEKRRVSAFRPFGGNALKCPAQRDSARVEAIV